MKILLLAVGLLLLNGCANTHFFEKWDYVNNRPGTGISGSYVRSGVNVDYVTVRSSAGTTTSYQIITPAK